MTPDTHYAKSGDVNIAYQVVGDAPRDLVLVPGWVSNIEVFWEEPACARFLRRLGVCPSNGSGAVSGGCQTITRVEIFDPEPNVRL